MESSNNSCLTTSEHLHLLVAHVCLRVRVEERKYHSALKNQYQNRIHFETQMLVYVRFHGDTHDTPVTADGFAGLRLPEDY